MKTLKNIMRRDRENILKVPRSVRDIIPVEEIYEDGIIRIRKGKYSKTWRFSDINYEIADMEDKKSMFYGYSDVLNTLDPALTTKITVYNRLRNTSDLEQSVLLPLTGDERDAYRKEMNTVISNASVNAASAIQEKYITVSVYCDNAAEARKELERCEGTLKRQFGRLGSRLKALNGGERIALLSGIFNKDSVMGNASAYYTPDLKHIKKEGLDVRDIIAPDGASIRDDYMVIEDKYARALFMKDYGSKKQDDVVSFLLDMDRDVFFSMDIIAIPTDEAIREAESRLLGVETNISNWQRRQNSNRNYVSEVPYDMEQERMEVKEFLDDLTTRDQKMFECVITVVQLADTKEQLDEDRAALKKKAAERFCSFGVLKYQQLEGLQTALPFGQRKVDMFRTLTTEALASFMPFRVQDIMHEGGMYYGINEINKNIISINRNTLQNANLIIIGTSGSGKSTAAKLEMVQAALKGDADILVIDPEAEYGRLVTALGGEVIKISSTSKNHINAMDITSAYGDGDDPVTLKSEFLLSLVEQIMKKGEMGPKERSVIDRCASLVYGPYIDGGYEGEPPTLVDFYNTLMAQPEREAKHVALAIELFTTGSLNTFAKPTNVDTQSHFICYDILELGPSLMSIGMLVVLDSILNRISKNRAEGRYTYLYVDEIYLMFMHEYSAEFFYKLWKRVRKYGARATGITQNISDLLGNPRAQEILSNSEFLIMMNQAPKDREQLADLLNISEEQISHISDVECGHGLMKVAGDFVPFANEFPKDTAVYGLITSKVEEVAGRK